MQDCYNSTLSDQVSIIGDFRNAYLVVTGVSVDEEVVKNMENYGILNLPADKGASVNC